MNKMNKKTICFFAVFLLFLGIASAASLLTKIEGEISGFSGIASLDNSDGTSLNVTIHNSTGGVVVSRNAAAGIYNASMTIVMTGAKFNLSYSTDYTYNLSTEYGDFTYNFTTPAKPTAHAFHTGQNISYATGDDADLDGTSKSYTDNGDDTITDEHTRLMWLKYDSGATTMNWTNALIYCNNNETAGYTDWRLPTAVEIITMIDYSCDSGTPDHCSDNFANAAFEWSNTDGVYWSSTTRPDDTGHAYIADMYDVGGIYDTGETGTNYVRCVRSE